MKDLRKYEETRQQRADPALHHAKAADRDTVAIEPAFVCAGCGRGYWQDREPIHCVKCGGMVFTRPPEPKAGEPVELRTAIHRISKDALAIQAAVRGDRWHRLANGAREVERIAGNMLADLVGGGT